jgi:hypothetical protein
MTIAAAVEATATTKTNKQTIKGTIIPVLN